MFSSTIVRRLLMIFVLPLMERTIMKFLRGRKAKKQDKKNQNNELT